MRAAGLPARALPEPTAASMPACPDASERRSKLCRASARHRPATAQWCAGRATSAAAWRSPTACRCVRWRSTGPVRGCGAARRAQPLADQRVVCRGRARSRLPPSPARPCGARAARLRRAARLVRSADRDDAAAYAIARAATTAAPTAAIGHSDATPASTRCRNLRLAVTETVTAAPRPPPPRPRPGLEARLHRAAPDRRGRPVPHFRPVPPAWLNGSFEDFLPPRRARGACACRLRWTGRNGRLSASAGATRCAAWSWCVMPSGALEVWLALDPCSASRAASRHGSAPSASAR